MNTCRNCDKPTTGEYCSTLCEEMDRHPAPRDDMAMMVQQLRYERVTFHDGDDGPIRKVDGIVLLDGELALLLRPVDKHGVDFSHYTKNGVMVDAQRLIDKALIVKRQPLRMNLHYGELEVAS